jgi:catechol 2,3-dioxygenase-like lactoylglutathione lyase family enzyme
MIRHLSGLAEVVEDIETTVTFYRDTLGLNVEFEEGNNYAVIELPGVLHFGLWSREAAATVILGSPAEGDRIPLGFMIGLEVDSVEEATRQVEENKATFIQATKKEDWGQVTSRMVAPSGVLIELTETPWARKVTQAMEGEQANGS